MYYYYYTFSYNKVRCIKYISLYKVPNPNNFGQLKENSGFQIAALLRCCGKRNKYSWQNNY